MLPTPEPAPLTDAELNAIQQRCDAATPGPWWVEKLVRAVLLKFLYDDVPTWIAESSERPERFADFAFIAHARADVPRLLAAMRAARADAATARERALREAADVCKRHAENHCRLGNNAMMTAAGVVRNEIMALAPSAPPRPPEPPR